MNAFRAQLACLVLGLINIFFAAWLFNRGDWVGLGNVFAAVVCATYAVLIARDAL